MTEDFPFQPIYLDHAATTPMRAEAVLAVNEAMQAWANPSSPHKAGRAARAMLEDARRRVGTALGWAGPVLFTSGASEGLAIAMNHAKAALAAVSATEHDAVLRLSGKAMRLPVDAAGRVDLQAVEFICAQRPGAMLAVHHVNNETGVIQDLAAVADIVHAGGGVLLADCTQSAGKIALPPADIIVLSAHKFGGPPGVGALLLREFGLLRAMGGQEQGYRPGTENLPGACGMAAALEARDDWMHRAAIWRAQIDAAVLAAGGQIIAADAPRLASIASYRMPGMKAAAQLIQFDMAGIAVSAGSACSSGSLKTSPVLLAMGLDDVAANEVVRISMGHTTTSEDVQRVIAVWQAMAQRAGAAR